MKTKALIANLFSFGLFFFGFRFLLQWVLELSYPLMTIGAAILASILAPKFLVQKERMYLKWIGSKKPKAL